MKKKKSAAKPARRTKKTSAAKKTSALKKSRAPQGSSEKARLKRNKDLVTKFYDLIINKKDFNAARKYMSDTYVQHNPTAADGPEGLKTWLEAFYRDWPQLHANIKRVVAEGDVVVLHVEGTNGPGASGRSAVVDIFRVKDGKVAEHWDVIQEIPVEAANSNSMF